MARNSKEQASLAEAVRHPLRVRILEVLNEVDMAPIDFVNAGHADFYFGHRPDVSHIAYHFRELEGFGCIEEVAWRRSRGSMATTYRGTARVEFHEDEWASLRREEKRSISRTVAQGLIARIDGAFMADTFLDRDDHQLSWVAMQLDEPGWKEVHDILLDAYTAVRQAEVDARARLEEQGRPGITATTAIAFFQSPLPPSAPAENKTDQDSTGR